MIVRRFFPKNFCDADIAKSSEIDSESRVPASERAPARGGVPVNGVPGGIVLFFTCRDGNAFGRAGFLLGEAIGVFAEFGETPAEVKIFARNARVRISDFFRENVIFFCGGNGRFLHRFFVGATDRKRGEGEGNENSFCGIHTGENPIVPVRIFANSFYTTAKVRR